LRIPNSILLGAPITACGVVLVGYTIWKLPNEVPRIKKTPKVDPNAQADKVSSCKHNWVNPDDPHDLLNYSYLTLRCTECGEEKSAWG
jgi:hypothetical protein